MTGSELAVLAVAWLAILVASASVLICRSSLAKIRRLRDQLADAARRQNEEQRP